MEECNITPTEFELFRKLIYRSAGIALTEAKKQLVQSRLRKRLKAHGLNSFGAYYELLLSQREDSPEMGAFINSITTNKTDFFREPHHFDFVTNTIVPEWKGQVKRGERPPRMRVWHAGCSTGEEPYTLAMTLAEAFEGERTWDIRQLASDIDTSVLTHAQQGVYEEERIAPVPAPLLHKYFLRGTGEREGYYKVRPCLQERIVFRQINLLTESWPIRRDVRFDIIFCRNVVIYFDKPSRCQLFARFAERLLPGGYLFIGHSESLLGISDAFDSLGRTIYRLPKTGAVRSLAA